jgi:hypothetical protein
MKFRLHQVFSIIMLLALFCAAQPAQPKRIKNRALVVGVNYYAQNYVKPTPGAEEDALAAAEFIQQKYGFLDSEIRVLTGRQATAANIVNTFRQWLIEGTEPGDRVYFHYSGHGSRIPDQAPKEEADGYDEVIAPYDVELRGQTFINVVTDDQIGQLIAQLSGRRVVMLFDSCHSGTISRGTGGGAAPEKPAPRFLPSPEELAALRSAPGTARGPGGFADYGVQDGNPATRDFKLVDEKAVGPATGIVVISAAQSGQLAYPMRVNGGVRGALSHVFSEVQDERPLTLRQLEQKIKQRIGALQQQGNLKGQQVPSFETISTVPLDDRPLFAGELAVAAIKLANPLSPIKLSLRTRDGKTRYRLKEKISYDVTTDRAGYLYLLVFSAENKAGCIFPNNEAPENKDNYLTAGAHRIPKADSFYAQEPIGEDVVIALLSDRKLNLVYGEDYTWDDIFDQLKSKKFFDYVTTRGQTAKKPPSGSPPATLDQVEWQAASLALYTVR